MEGLRATVVAMAVLGTAIGASSAVVQKVWEYNIETLVNHEERLQSLECGGGGAPPPPAG